MAGAGSKKREAGCKKQDCNPLLTLVFHSLIFRSLKTLGGSQIVGIKKNGDSGLDEAGVTEVLMEGLGK